MSQAVPRLAVAIPTYNRPAALDRCLRSIRAGTRRPDQIVVCDQSREPAMQRAVEAVCAQAPSTTYLHLAVPNASRARNAGWEAADADLVAYLDDDCVAGAGWLAALAGEYQATSAAEPVAAVTGAVLPLFTAGHQVALSSRQAPARRVFRARDGGLARREWAPWDIGTGANLLVPRAALQRAGGWDPRLGPGTPARAAEDVDLLYRLTGQGSLVYQPAAIVYHPAGTRRDHLFSRYTYGAGMGYMLAKHIAAGDRTARDLLALYLRHRGRNVFRFRHGLWSQPEALLLLAGVGGALLRARVRPRF